MDKKDLMYLATGGYGNIIMRTSILNEMKEKYRDVYIVCPYDDVWKTDKDLNVFNQAPASLYSQLLKDNDEVEVVAENPYNNSDFIQKKIHFNDAVRDLFGFERIGTKACMDELPIIGNLEELIPGIEEDAKKVAKELKKDNKKKYIVLVQSSGGQSPFNNPNDILPIGPEPLVRNYKFFPELMDLLKDKYKDVLFVQYKLPQEKKLPHTRSVEKIALWYREFAKHCDGAILIDSSLQHLTNGILPSLVLWGETRPEHFGHSFHKNIDFAKNDLSNEEPYFQIFQNKPAVVRYKTAEQIYPEVEEYLNERLR